MISENLITRYLIAPLSADTRLYLQLCSRGPGTLTYSFPEQDWTKILDLIRNCVSFRFCTRRKALWSPETFGGHWAHGLPCRHPAVGYQLLAVTVIAPSCLHRNVQHMYENAFTRCPTGTPVKARELKISVEIKSTAGINLRSSESV